MNTKFCVICILLVALLFVTPVFAIRSSTDTKVVGSISSASEDVCVVRHSVGKIALVVQNNGKFGLASRDAGKFRDCFTGTRLSLGCEYPRDSKIDHLYRMSIWVGGIEGGDTLVSTGSNRWFDGSWFGAEFVPDDLEAGFIKRSTLDPNRDKAQEAVSEEDIETSYTDTVKAAHIVPFSFFQSRPLNLKITQKSYAWSYEFAEDVILFEMEIENIGWRPIEKVFVGLYCKSWVGVYGRGGGDMCGLLSAYNTNLSCGFPDTLNMAWMADNDGAPVDGEFLDHVIWENNRPLKSCPTAFGIYYLNKPTENSILSFNWWQYHMDFGPRHKEDFRDFGTGTIGYPEGDRNRYHILSNGEIDYDVAYTAQIQQGDYRWMYPANRADAIRAASGLSPEMVLSMGPFELLVGASTTIAFAFVGGERFHVDPANGTDNLPDNPREYYKNLDFSDLAKNAMWAKWIYDNPGFDTDGDGYRGRYWVCVYDSILSDSGWVATVADTTWYEGDGIPDWRAAVPPTPPKFWITPVMNGINVRFNGSRTETERDALTRLVDFEGYNVWMGRDDREGSYSLVASYDIENYDKYVWNENSGTLGNFLLDDIPFSLERIRCAYGSSCDDESFKPLDYTRGSPYFHPDQPDSIFYFAPHHYNAGLGTITKVYPDAQQPPSYIHPDSLDRDFYTEEGNFKFYEYEFTIKNLLPTVPYYVNVTAFDFGSPRQGLQPLETSKTLNAKDSYPFSGDEHGNEQELKAYVYPNPYRKDGDYREQGYEGRSLDMLPDDKVRAVHFANLPAKCWISVFSLDGDLIRKLRHDYDYDDPNRFHETWDLINRNRQIIVSGLYYWTVESDDGRVQIGKLVILM